MVSVSEATAIIQAHLFKPQTQEVALENAIGRTLAMELVADRDFPPFNRVAMDGIAIQHEQFRLGIRKFTIEGIAAAGEPQKKLLHDENCIEVMTGAPLPNATDSIIRYEDIDINEGSASIKISSVEKYQNIHPVGKDAAKGAILLRPGVRLSPAEIALVATVGKTTVTVKSNPRVAIISTGNELVDIAVTPLAHQIRKSNVYAIQAALSAMKCDSTLFHLTDVEDVILKELDRIIENHDLIILSGGVSKGKFDFIPSALEQLGVVKHFHKVKQKPGKPFWFGTQGNKTFFALPGNPTSTYLCFYRYVEPWLKRSWGLTNEPGKALLSTDFAFHSDDLTYFLQVRVENSDGTLWAHPVPGGGSGDLGNLKDVDGFMELPTHKNQFKKGSIFPIYLFR